MLTKVRALSTAGLLLAVTSSGALADFSPTGTYMGPPLDKQPAPTATAPTPIVTAQATYPTTTGAMPNYYSPYGAASPVITGGPEGSGTNPYQSGVGTGGHAPLR